MNLSNSGRVVILDDKLDEAMPLMTILGKSQIPFLFFDGTEVNLPNTQLKGIRYLFLDINLGAGYPDHKNIASVLIARLKKIISTKNGPYFIIFWTERKDFIDQVLTNCEKAKIKPIGHICLAKGECKDKKGEYNLENITNKIDEAIKDIGAFCLYTKWENVLHESSVDYIKYLSKIIPHDDDWTKNTSAMFYKFAKTYVGKNKTSSKIQFQHACELLNRSFLDKLSQNTSKSLSLPDRFMLQDSVLGDTIISKINYSLFCSDQSVGDYSPGSVYVAKKNTELKGILMKGFGWQPETTCELLTVIITPECDIARNKTLTKDTIKIHRIISGLLFENQEDKKGSPPASIFNVGPIFIDQTTKLLKLHFGTLSYANESDIGTGFKFYIKRDLLFDIQSKSANHVNRLGNFQIECKAEKEKKQQKNSWC